MNFRYRFVRYGTNFEPQRGERTEASSDPHRLYENELVVDVGGACWGYKGETRAVIDHHFAREAGQFPSAAAAVLHKAAAIRDRFQQRDGDMWLVTHWEPDFDAFCATYLARALLLGQTPADCWESVGLHADGWLPVADQRGGTRRKKIDWFNPDLRGLDDSRRWAVLLAAYAACVDNCRRVACPAHRSLHSVLYAALHRGRDYANETSGAQEFFTEVQRVLAEDKLNPLFDSVFEESPLFAPELRLLDREAAAYQRDVKAARRTVVYLQQANDEFDRWFAEVKKIPLFDGGGELVAKHAQPAGTGYGQADGIFIRDPECLLFKEWARNDLDNSPMGAGFLFTAIAYSDGRPSAPVNTSSYFFALDPERSGRLHLYNVWARLQAREIAALHQPEHAAIKRKFDAERRAPREEFKERAVGPHAHCFFDPWFDGENYNCTIVPTPNDGSLMQAGTARDLGDDHVARVVQQEFESSLFDSPLVWRTFSTDPADPRSAEQTCTIDEPHLTIRDSHVGSYCFFRVQLQHSVQILKGQMAEQLGRALWRHLAFDGESAVPPDFAERHLISTEHWVGVWGRRGVGLAYQERALPTVLEFEKLVGELASLSLDLESLIARMKETRSQVPRAAEHGERAPDPAEEILMIGEGLLLRVAEAKRALAFPENRLVRRFFEASRLDEVFQMTRDVYMATAEKAQADRSNQSLDEIAEVQRKLEWAEVFIISVYFVELLHFIADAFEIHNPFTGAAFPVIALMALSGALLMLRPWARGGFRWKKFAALLVAAMLTVAAFVAGGLMYKHAQPQHQGEHAQPSDGKR